MKVNQDQILIAFDKYFENEILNKAPNGLEKFKMGFVYGRIKNKMPEIVNKIKQNEMSKMLGIFDEDGFVDIDEIMKTAKESMAKTGKITIGNLVFSDNDLQIIYNYLKEV